VQSPGKPCPKTAKVTRLFGQEDFLPEKYGRSKMISHKKSESGRESCYKAALCQIKLSASCWGLLA
jgi:hypothetical protein